MSELWWLAERPGRQRGPFTDDEITAMLAEGKLAAGEAVWSSSTGIWSPARERRKAQASRPGLRRLGAAMLILAYACGFAACAVLIGFRSIERLDANLAAFIWPVAGGTALAASLGLLIAWLRPGRLGARRPELAAVRSVAVGLLGLGGVVAGSLALYQQHDAILTLRGLRELTYDVHIDAARQVIQVKGSIGPGFDTALTAALDRPGAPNIIEITSLGGLTDEALSAAKRIEGRGVRVVARRICASACLVLLMAGDERLADVDTRLDFHAPAPISGSTAPAIVYYVKQHAQPFRDYLEARGAPKDVLDAAYRIGPGKVESLSALEALDLHILTGVVDGDAPVDRAELERRLAKSPRRVERSSVLDEE